MTTDRLIENPKEKLVNCRPPGWKELSKYTSQAEQSIDVRLVVSVGRQEFGNLENRSQVGLSLFDR